MSTRTPFIVRLYRALGPKGAVALAVFALPFFAGVTAGGWAYHTGAGWLGAILIGTVAAGLTLGFCQVLLATVRPLWAKFAIAAIFVVIAPASPASPPSMS